MGGFATSNTRGSDKLARELEERTKHLDVFTDEFSPPGSPRQTVPGQDVTKGVEYQKPHDDGAGRTDLPVNRRDRVERGMSAAGNAKDQKPLDDLDKEIQKREGQIKKPTEQFPTGYEKGLAMPFESKSQRGFMWWKHPEIAKRWEKVTPSDKALPEQAKGKKAMSEIDDDEAVNKEKDELKKELKKLSGPDKLSKLNGFVEKRLTRLANEHIAKKIGDFKIMVGQSENKWWYAILQKGENTYIGRATGFASEEQATGAAEKWLAGTGKLK